MASGSRHKRKLLERLDLTFDTDAAELDESPAEDEQPSRTAKRLAAAKATAVAERHPEHFVLGADQTVALEGERFHKPGTRDSAIEQLKQLSGRTHDLWCAVALVTPDEESHRACVHYEMQMRDVDEPTIRSYVDRDRPLDCAGSYKIEAGGIRLFRSMRGDDYTAIVGLPLTRVWELLERAGYFEDR